MVFVALRDFFIQAMRYHSYLNSAKAIIDSYTGDVPFAAFLKKYFNAHKKYGGKDRKQIGSLCYNFFRLGKAVPHLPVTEKIIVAVFLCEAASNDFLEFHKPEWNALITKPLPEKMEIAAVAAADVFPWAEALSEGTDAELFRYSFFKQPELFLRIRPGKKNSVIKKLTAAGIDHRLLTGTCIALSNATKIDSTLEIDREVVIQDYNSQQVLNGIGEYVKDIAQPLHVWDCCAASGGKSILLSDTLDAQIDLTVSDIRESILANLKQRFEVAGIKNYQSFTVDLGAEDLNMQVSAFNMIICDAPCTGSGTWSRTPEQLYFLKRKTVDVYVALQQRIVSNAIPKLLPGGIFVYITCSVFKHENEELVDYIKEKFHLQLLQMELLKGYDKKADSMFAAVFRNS